MLVLPLLAAAYLLHPPPGRLLASFVLVMALFLSRAPLIVVARQRWVWRSPHEETAEAWRWLRVLVPAAAISGFAAIPSESWSIAANCGVGAAVLMGLSVWLAVRNRQHSILFQAAGSAGLAASSLVAGLAAPPLSATAWILWASFALHGISAIPVVHARLALRRKQKPDFASASIGALLTLAIAAAMLPGRIAIPLGFSGLAHLAEWFAVRRPGAGQAKLTHLGLRLMTESIGFTLLLVWALGSI